MTIPFEIRNRWTNEVQVTAQIDCPPDAPVSIKLGLAVQWAVKERADLRGANLCGAKLCWADLCGAKLNWADLRETNLRGAKLNWADLRDVDLRETKLCGADLSGANPLGDDQ